MMKFRYKYLLVFLLTAFTISSCKDFIGGDTNVSPNFVGAEAVTMDALLPTTIYRTSQSHYLVAFSTSRIPQQTASYFEEGFDSHFPTTLGGAWTSIYLNTLTNLFEIEKIARVEKANHYLGITQVLQAINIGLLTDNWEDVPYYQAFLGEANFTPTYDSQQSLYAEINTLLDEAIANLSVENASIFIPGSDDLAFGGNMANWVKVAYALKARYAIHLTNQGASAAASNALSAIADGMTSNSDDLQLDYNTVNLNPYHTGVALANTTGNFSIMLSNHLVNAMDGTTFGVFDPRLPLMADNGGDDSYIGGANGAGGSGIDGVSINADFGETSYYSSATAPIFMITYAEQKFIEAEAIFLTNGGTATSIGSTQAAYDAYTEGITAHMDKLGVATADKEAYLTDPNVAVSSTGLTLALIMNEKMKATFLNPEAWVDLRRYDNDPNVFINLTLPAMHDPDLAGAWIQRAEFPSDEFSRNGDNANAARKDNAAKMWRDQ
ncbi:MAG: SusD/RagB family nutrient-binding outer membrane lipoprotein [Cyclobacteriaceae bacterium]|nr:SusD/RagB family nutrient-binding outer membrane lipoprotein [Cyclobacteriaceae bacterium]